MAVQRIAKVIGALTIFLGTGCLADLPPAPAGVQTRVLEGVEFSVIDAPGNAAFRSDLRPDTYPAQGRGSVPYSFGLARTEVTTGQWMEFVNTFSILGGDFTQFGQPIRWGARLDQSFAGPGWRWELNPARPQAAEVPVWGLSWREAAMYTNWLHNGRSADPASITHGAYNTATFGYPDDNFFNGFTDQLTRSPDARFWIPSLDEWIKGAFFDSAQERWWLSHYGSDTHPVYGSPNDPGAQSNDGMDLNALRFYMPLTAFHTQSPFGLLSTSGGPEEWFEDAVGTVPTTGLPAYRLFYQGNGGGTSPDADLIFRAGLSGELPDTGLFQTIRIASAVPSPAPVVVVLGLMIVIRERKRV